MYNIIRLNLIWGNIDMEKNNDFFIRSTFRTYLIPSILALLRTTITVLIDSIIIGNGISDQCRGSGKCIGLYWERGS